MAEACFVLSKIQIDALAGDDLRDLTVGVRRHRGHSMAQKGFELTEPLAEAA
jgi:hypothetical protein